MDEEIDSGDNDEEIEFEDTQNQTKQKSFLESDPFFQQEGETEG